MVEIPQNTQFVGSADMRGSLTALPNQEQGLTLSPEQKMLTDMFQKSGEMSRHEIGKAMEQAGKKLQQLHGKELVTAGLKKVGLGLGLGWATETGGAFISRKIGEKVINRAGPAIDKVWQKLPDHIHEYFPNTDPAEIRESIQKLNHEMYNGGMENMTDLLLEANTPISSSLGKFGGGEFTSPLYGLLTRKANLPKVRWYEWVVGQFGAFYRNSTTLKIKNFELNLVNPVTVSGFLNVAKGSYEMVFGQK